MKPVFSSLSVIAAMAIASPTAYAQSFNDTGDILARSAQVEDIEYQMMVQRATQAAIWGMPAAGMIDFLKGIRRDLGGDYNDVVYLNKPFDSKHGFLTANDVTAYAWASMTSEPGPLVIQVPAATDKVSYFGSIVNAWDTPIADVGPDGFDKGEGGKYLMLPPGYDEQSLEELSAAGYMPFETDTYEYGFSFRPRLYNGATDLDAAEYAQTIKIYYLSEADNPPPNTYHEASEVPYDSLPYYNHTYFQDLNDYVQNNPIRPQDKIMVNFLKDLGIEKDKPFEPNERQIQAMNEGLVLAYAAMQRYFVEPGLATVPLWVDENGELKNQWLVWDFAEGQPEAGFPYETDTEVLVDDRAGGSYFWITYLPKNLGGGTFYLTGLRDSAGEMYDHNATYKLNVPADTPARDFWSVIVYSMETKSFIRNVDPVGLSSRDADTMQVNDDGSYDIYFGPTAPDGKESNWIPTTEPYFLLFRLYGPEEGWLQSGWILPDMEKISD
ncbi:DUF1214 domain-containing protein [Roseibium sp. RKSG952]|uniref:DUF1214 domain-containing protein n=1 Tax=Roseibium sp. RKSG952 TaxID=2529384 RepID=UPI0012BC952E|nr:DUF1214 domain-containing protein [Roseibium sp. RKSG952]MTI02193.1 DUF1254 domain-containing protein [Roseibium sp. RKSG952]